MARAKIHPLDDRVLVQPQDAQEITAGGIILPDSAKEKPQRGTVVAVGSGPMLESGDRGSMGVSVGDVVIYGKYAGNDIKVDGHEHKILREKEILAKLV